AHPRPGARRPGAPPQARPRAHPLPQPRAARRRGPLARRAAGAVDLAARRTREDPQGADLMRVATFEPLVVTHRYNALPEKVFDAFLDPKIACRFLFATANGEMIEASVEARVGGRFAFTDKRPDMGEVRHVGEYLEIDRPKRLKFTFGVPQ